ncbi:MAG TPA: radical SAM protein, partial [Candidatus Omnitrophota bacterium]|nr:radical SAM protein [Candidatus Omnitrophota bacterium]
FVYRNYGIKFFHFLDDTFTIDRGFAADIFRLIIERRLPVKWMAMTRADAIVRKIKPGSSYEEECSFLRLAKDAGCVGVAIGVESGDEKILELLNKKLDLAVLSKATELCKRSGIPVKYFLMVGVPGQDEASIQKTIDVIKDNKPDSVNVTVVKPLPGSELFDLWLAVRREAVRTKDPSRVFSQEEVLDIWRNVKGQIKDKAGLISLEPEEPGDLMPLWDMLMFEEEPGLKGRFMQDKLYPAFETREVPLHKTMEFRQAIMDAHNDIAKEIKAVPVFRRIFPKEKIDAIVGSIRHFIGREQFEMGRHTYEFENKFSETVGKKFAVAVSNGTVALEL